MTWTEYEMTQINQAAKELIGSGDSCYKKARELLLNTLHYRTHDSIRRKLQTVVSNELDQRVVYLRQSSAGLNDK